MKKVAEIEKEIEGLKEERTNRGEALVTAETMVTRARAKRDEAKALFENNLSTGKDLGKSEKQLKDAENELWVAERKRDGTETAVAKLDEEVTTVEADLRKAREVTYVEEAEKILRELRGLQANQVGPLQRAYMLVEAMQDNQGHRAERYRIDAVRVRYTDPLMIALKSSQVLHAKMTQVGGKDSPVMPMETLEPDLRTEACEWLPYQIAERLVREKKCVIVEERQPVFDSQQVFDPLPAVFDDLTSLNLGRFILHGAVPAMVELSVTIGNELTTTAIGPTVDKKEMKSYLGEVER